MLDGDSPKSGHFIGFEWKKICIFTFLGLIQTALPHQAAPPAKAEAFFGSIAMGVHILGNLGSSSGGIGM